MNKHTWVKTWKMAYEVCKDCGLIKNKKNVNGFCKGKVNVILRNEKMEKR